MNANYNFLATRSGFNVALRHFQLVTDIAQDVGDGYNLVDIIYQEVKDQTIEQQQVLPIVNALLFDKFNYAFISFNFNKNRDSAEKIADILSKWNALQMVVVYFNPVTGIALVNPAIAEHIADVLPFIRDEYCIVYVGSTRIKDDAVLQKAARDVVKVLNGTSVTPDKRYLSGYRKKYVPPQDETAVEEQPATDEAEQTAAQPAQAATTPSPAAGSAESSGIFRVTAKYSVLVTNELFHNGNVEAWKKIIQSYTAKFPGNEVLIWYEHEKINDINTLFKWGKVKNGTPIIFSVAGTQLTAISKLQKYLFEGASPRFESFLKGNLNQILALF